MQKRDNDVMHLTDKVATISPIYTVLNLLMHVNEACPVKDSKSQSKMLDFSEANKSY